MAQTTYSQTQAIGFTGQVDSNGQFYDYLTMKNVDAVSIPFGRMVAFLRTGATSDYDAILPAASTAVPAGIVVRLQSYARTWTDSTGAVIGELDGTGLTVNTFMTVLNRGRILVLCQTGCIPGDPLFVSYGAATTYTAKGQLGNVTESTNALDLTAKGTWDSTSTAGTLAWLKLVL